MMRLVVASFSHLRSAILVYEIELSVNFTGHMPSLSGVFHLSLGWLRGHPSTVSLLSSPRLGGRTKRILDVDAWLVPSRV